MLALIFLVYLLGVWAYAELTDRDTKRVMRRDRAYPQDRDVRAWKPVQR